MWYSCSSASAASVAALSGTPASVRTRLKYNHPRCKSLVAAIVSPTSSRRFAREPVSFRQLSTTLFRATRGVPADFLDPHGAQLNDVYVVAHAVDVFWLVKPVFAAQASMGVLDVAAVVVIGSVWLAIFRYRLGQRPLVARFERPAVRAATLVRGQH